MGETTNQIVKLLNFHSLPPNTYHRLPITDYQLPITDYPIPNLVENKEGNSGKKVT
jgi:hypothetical protein